MFFSKVSLVCRFSTVVTSEKVLNKIPMYLRNENFSKQFLKCIELNADIDMFNFPIKSFKTMPNGILKKLFDDIHKTILKSQMVPATQSYSKLLYHYLQYKIDFDIYEILNDIIINDVEIDKNIFKSVVRKCSQNGDFVTIRKIKNMMEEYTISILEDIEVQYYSAYIRAGKESEAAELAEQYKLNEDSPYFLLESAKAYAGVHSWHKLQEKLQQLANKEEYSKVMLIYEEAVQAEFSESDLARILEFNLSNDIEILLNTVSNLNRKCYFKQSLALVSKLLKLFSGSTSPNKEKIFEHKASIIIASFNNRNCPPDLYLDVLSSLMDIANPVYKNYSHIFSSFSFVTSVTMCQQLTETVKRGLLFKQLGYKLSTEFSPENLSSFLLFGQRHLHRGDVNGQFLLVFPILVDADTKDIGAFIEKHDHKNVTVPTAMLHALCKADIDIFQQLKLKYFRGYFNYYIYTRYLPKIILKNYSIANIDVFVTEFHSVFPHLTKSIQSALVVEILQTSSTFNNLQGIKSAVIYAEANGVKLMASTKYSLFQKCDKYKEHL